MDENIKGTVLKREKKSGISKGKSTEVKRKKKAAHDVKPREVITPKGKDSTFHIVGMCASAGGLEAFEEFFKNMPRDSGMAFILVPHLDPTHKSMMVDLIKRCTKMSVLEAEDGMQIMPDNVYVIPPDKDLALFHNRLQLSEPVKPRGHRYPIDYFLRTLAEDQGEKAICIILSGTGADGTMGLKSIKESGGMVMVQDPANAKYDGMPRSAIDTDLVDYILPAEKMPEQLVKYIKFFERPAKGDVGISRKAPDSLQKIFLLLRNHTGNDFSLYKRNTIMRRIERRMSVHQIDKLPAYVRFLQENPHEIDMLFKELLIGVTNFFRDREAFDVLKTKVCPSLFEGRPYGDSLRIWVAGCSTGEEAYSIAIVLKEYMEENSLDFGIQIFASDIDVDAIDAARAGVYPGSIAVDVSPERLGRYFVKEGNSYRVDKRIREMIIFAIHNVIKYPPFSHLDMISCRNLLIYLDAELQKKILPLFHYALKPQGILFLGSAETIGTFVDLFDVLDKKWKFYKRKELMLHAHPMVEFPVAMPAPVKTAEAETQPHETVKKAEETIKPSAVVERILLDSYAPPCVVINQKGDIVHIIGRTGKYLEPAPGEAKMNILEMAREGLRTSLQSAIHKCLSESSGVVIRNVQVKVDDAFQVIDLTVKPVHSIYRENLMMVLFEEKRFPEVIKKGKSKLEVKKGYSKHLLELEQELKYTKENLKTTIEELETSNEELRSTNEEMQSANEELHSSNEELEAAKEETQSLNEELITVNSELRNKVDELTQVNSDMKNVLDGTHIATIFVDNNLKIKRFTPETSKIINLIEADINRPISHIATNLAYKDLVDDIGSVLKSLVSIEKEVQMKDGRWYLMRIMPYRTLDNVINGVVITFVDIDVQKNVQTALQDALLYAEGIVNTLREGLIVLDKDLRVMSANQVFYHNFHVTKEETEGKLIYDLGNRQWDIPKLRELLEEIIPQNTEFNNYEVEHAFPDVGHRVMLLNARCIDQKDGRGKLILLAIEDVTGRK